MAGAREAIPALGGAHVASSALTGLCRQLAAELGPDQVRVAWLLSPGSPDEPANHEADPYAAATLLGRRPSYDDIANAAAFLSSEWAHTITAIDST